MVRSTAMHGGAQVATSSGMSRKRSEGMCGSYTRNATRACHESRKARLTACLSVNVALRTLLHGRFQSTRIHARHALDGLGRCNRLVDLGLGGERTCQGDDAILGFNLDLGT